MNDPLKLVVPPQAGGTAIITGRELMIGVEGGRVVEWGVAVGTAEQLGELALTRWAKFGAWVRPRSRCER